MANFTIDTAALNDPRTKQAFDTIKKCVGFFGIVSAIVLATCVVVAFMHQEVTTFMWVRGAILLLVAPLMLSWVNKAANGAGGPYDRLATVSVILPIAIIAVDLIPGICPAWYAVMQGISALPLIGVAVLTRNSQVRAAFRKQKK